MKYKKVFVRDAEIQDQDDTETGTVTTEAFEMASRDRDPETDTIKLLASITIVSPDRHSTSESVHSWWKSVI